jgi:hypothetical protein
VGWLRLSRVVVWVLQSSMMALAGSSQLLNKRFAYFPEYELGKVNTAIVAASLLARSRQKNGMNG